jgi:hypothetical protein
MFKYYIDDLRFQRVHLFLYLICGSVSVCFDDPEHKIDLVNVDFPL